MRKSKKKAKRRQKGDKDPKTLLLRPNVWVREASQGGKRTSYTVTRQRNIVEFHTGQTVTKRQLKQLMARGITVTITR